MSHLSPDFHLPWELPKLTLSNLRFAAELVLHLQVEGEVIAIPLTQVELNEFLGEEYETD